ncbi:MAG: S41 family peptidase, partial [Planctomycetota bacterium]
KPIIVLCNQNSFSNAEIFSHAIRNLNRGKLVGVQTAGGVISTGSVSILDIGRMRMPFRAWFVAADGEDMELNGAKPHVSLWNPPGEVPAGKDRQLNRATRMLMKEVKSAAKANPMPTLKYQTQR